MFSVTPFNVVRAIRHVQAVDKSLILPAITYTDFIKQIVGDVDPVTHGMIFELLIELIYQHDVFEGENLPEYQEANQNIGRDCFPVLDVMINQLVRIAHSSGAFKCPSMHPAIQLFSSGEKLQFIIDSITRHLEKSPTIIRHLHAISIAFHETKAAEIALRFIMTIRFTEPNYVGNRYMLKIVRISVSALYFHVVLIGDRSVLPETNGNHVEGILESQSANRE